MEEQRPYLKPNITISDLALYLGTNRTYLSKVINEEFNQNFNKFINNYRLQYSKKYLINNKEMNISTISELCGFNSYSTFNRCFKEKYGILPSQFSEEKDNLNI